MATTHKTGTTLRAPTGELVLVLGHTARFVLLLVPGGCDQYAPLARYGAAAVTEYDLRYYAPVVGETARPTDREEALACIGYSANRLRELVRDEVSLGRRAEAAEHAEIATGLWDVVHRCRAATQARRAA